MSRADEMAATAITFIVIVWLLFFAAVFADYKGRPRRMKRRLISLLAFVSLPLVWVGGWLNDRADAKTARLWRTCPWCGHDSEPVFAGTREMCPSLLANKNYRRRGACLCHHHGPKAWYRQPEARA
jgi:hypothetical protein